MPQFLYGKNMNIILSPIEKIHIISGIKKKLLTNKMFIPQLLYQKKLVINLNLV